MTDSLLTEIERQQKYLDRLPNDFEFPLFNARQALETRDAGNPAAGPSGEGSHFLVAAQFRWLCLTPLG